jgi:hypothetical protein
MEVPMQRKLVLVSAVLAACHSDSDSTPLPVPEPGAINLGLAVQRQFGQGNLRLIEASEAAQGHDLTGDGDPSDVVWHILDLPSLTLTNTGLASPSLPLARDEVPPPGAGCSDALAVFQVSESATGLDLDQDGDPDETATWTFNRRTGRLEGLPFAHDSMVLAGDIAAFFVFGAFFGEDEVHVFDGRDGRLTTLPEGVLGLVAAGDGIVAVTRSEQGAFDLNAAGDSSDLGVVHLYDTERGRLLNASFDLGPGLAQVRAGFLGFTVFEALHGELDLNGDGDALDLVFVAVNGRNGLMRLPGLCGASSADPFDPVQERFALMVSEDGVDRNGDGNAFDAIAVLYDPVRDQLVDTGLASAMPNLVESRDWIGVTVPESPATGDLDGDGRLDSFVPHVYDARTGRVQSLGFRGFFSAALDGQLLGLRLSPTALGELFVWDPRRGTVHFPFTFALQPTRANGDSALVPLLELDGDRNGDGDRADVVVGLYDARTLSITSLGLAVAEDPILSPDGHAAVLVPESSQGGSDLNGDGDAEDVVLHVLTLAPPRG